MWSLCNTFSKINVCANKLQRGGGFATRWKCADKKVTGSRKLAKKENTHIRDREMSGKMKRLKSKKEVQVITFNYFTFTLTDTSSGEVSSKVLQS